MSEQWYVFYLIEKLIAYQRYKSDYSKWHSHFSEVESIFKEDIENGQLARSVLDRLPVLPRDIFERVSQGINSYIKFLNCFDLPKKITRNDSSKDAIYREIENIRVVMAFWTHYEKATSNIRSTLNNAFENYVRFFQYDEEQNYDFISIRSERDVDIPSLLDRFLYGLLKNDFCDLITDKEKLESKHTANLYNNPWSNPYAQLKNHIVRNISNNLDQYATAKSPIGEVLKGVAKDYIDNYVTGSQKTFPYQYSPDEIINKCLQGTGLENLFVDLHYESSVPLKLRMEHQYILGSTGSGKSTLISDLLLQDFDRVAKNEASVVVMDSKRDLIKSIENLARFGKGGDLEDRLVLIDVEDSVEFPIALNLMDLSANQDGLSPRDKEAFRNSTLAMLNYFFESLLGSGSELTSRQRTVFNFIIQLLMEIPGANLDDLLNLLEANSLVDFESAIAKLDDDAQRYFDTQFMTDGKTRATKSELVSRIYAIKSNKTLSRLFSARKTKLNLFDELSSSKVILINCAKSILQDEVEIFGRFMLGMILLAAERRQLLKKAERLPTYVYMDEAHDIIKRDTKLPTILSQARAFNVGMIISHQDFSQILDTRVISALLANTAIKCTGAIAAVDAGRLASSMGIETSQLTNPPDYTFNVSAKRVGSGTYKPAHIDFDKMEKMSDSEHEQIIAKNRAKYCIDPYSTDSTKLSKHGLTAVAETEGNYETGNDPLDNTDPNKFL